MSDIVRDPYGNPLRRNDELEQVKPDTNTALRAEVEQLTREVDVAAEMLREAKADLKAMRAAVLEEAARVADRNAAEAWAEGSEETRGLMRMQAADIAAAIRAMIPSGKDQ